MIFVINSKLLKRFTLHTHTRINAAAAQLVCRRPLLFLYARCARRRKLLCWPFFGASCTPRCSLRFATACPLNGYPMAAVHITRSGSARRKKGDLNVIYRRNYLFSRIIISVWFYCVNDGSICVCTAKKSVVGGGSTNGRTATMDKCRKHCIAVAVDQENTDARSKRESGRQHN